MNRTTGIVLAVVGLVVLLLGLYPSHLLGRFNGVGGLGGGHTVPDLSVVIGAVALVTGIYSLLRQRPA